LFVSEIKHTSLIEILNKDADFLASCDIIDYSLLLGEIIENPDLRN
jgi:hypothetical protein